MVPCIENIRRWAWTLLWVPKALLNLNFFNFTDFGHCHTFTAPPVRTWWCIARKIRRTRSSTRKQHGQSPSLICAASFCKMKKMKPPGGKDRRTCVTWVMAPCIQFFCHWTKEKKHASFNLLFGLRSNKLCE